MKIIKKQKLTLKQRKSFVCWTIIVLCLAIGYWTGAIFTVFFFMQWNAFAPYIAIPLFSTLCVTLW